MEATDHHFHQIPFIRSQSLHWPALKGTRFRFYLLKEGMSEDSWTYFQTNSRAILCGKIKGSRQSLLSNREEGRGAEIMRKQEGWRRKSMAGNPGRTLESPGEISRVLLPWAPLQIN